MHCNMTTLKRSKNHNTLTSFLEDFRAKTLALQEMELVSLETDPHYFFRCSELYGKLDQNTLSLKTAQCCLFEDLNTSCNRFPKSGIYVNGNVYQTSNLDFLTLEKEYTLLPTVTHSSKKRGQYKDIHKLKAYLSTHQKDAVECLSLKGFTKSQIVTLLELMMGFPIGHTELER